MFEIITENNCVCINDMLIPKSKYTITRASKGVRLDHMDLDYTKTKIDGVQCKSAEYLFNFLKEHAFCNEGGASPVTDGVKSVTGSLVDNTDAKNPKVNLPKGGTENTFLCGDGTWKEVSVGSDSSFVKGSVISSSDGAFEISLEQGKFSKPPIVMLTPYVNHIGVQCFANLIEVTTSNIKGTVVNKVGSGISTTINYLITKI